MGIAKRAGGSAMLARHFLLAVLALMTGLLVIPDASAQTTYTVCSKQGSELDLNSSGTSGMRAKLSNTNYFGPGGTVAPEQMAFQSLSSVNSGSLAACDIFIGGGFPENLSVAETQAIRTWVNSGNRFVIAGCDSSSHLLCGPNGLQRSLTNISSGFGVSLSFGLAYNPLTCGGVSGVDTYGGAATVISSLAGDATLATHNGTYTGQPAAIAPDLVAPEFLMTADPDMYGSSGNGVIGTSAIASSDQAVFVLNSFKFAADALSGRLQNPQCPVDYNSAGDLEIGLTASAASVSVGGTVDFEIEVANTGGASVGDIEALFEVPAGFSFVSESGPGSYDSASGVWTLGALNPGDSVTLTVTATAAAAGSPQARAEITRANLPDSDSAPNAGFGEDDLADGLNDDDEASLAMAVQAPPVTVDDASAGHAPGSPASLDPLANDTDPDGAIDPTTVRIAGTGAPGDPLSVTGEGTWSVNASTGEISFTPEPGFHLDPSPVQYSVADTDGNRSAPASVSLDYDVYFTSLADASVTDTCQMPSLYIADGDTKTWPTRPGTSVTAATNMGDLTTNTDRTLLNIGGEVRNGREATRWQMNGGNINLTLDFSPALPADEIALMVYDVGLGAATPYSASFSFGVSGGAQTSDFASSGVAEHSLTLEYAGETGTLAKSDPRHTVRESAVLVGQDASLVSQLTLSSSGLSNADFLGVTLFPVNACDQSDAPDGTALGTAQHTIVGGFRLGAAIDAENAPQPSAGAEGDDLDMTGDDEDGVSFPGLIQGQTAAIDVSVTQASGGQGYLQAWIDWNGDGDFDDPGEQVAADRQSASAGTHTLSLPVNVPPGATTQATFSRFRWSSRPGLASGGAAPDGEVEDYSLTIQPGGPTVSGRVFEDNGAGGASAHDGLAAGDEAGIGGVRILARDAGGAVIARTESDGDGLYTLVLPLSAAGSQVTFDSALAGAGWRHVSGRSGDLPAPSDTLASNGEVGFTPALAAAYTGVDIGQVRRPQLKAPRLASLSPGQSVILGHTFTATTAGTVDLTLSDIEASPASGFTQALFADTDCDGVIGPAETVVSGPLGVAAGDETCLLVRVSAAPGIPGDSRLDYTLMADFAYAGTALGEELANDDRVTVSPEGALELTKQVCNLTVSACDAASGTGFAPANTGRPGDVLIYRIGFENPGPDAIDEVDIHDDTPAYSRLTATSPDVVAAPAGLSCTLVSPVAPAAGYTGDLHWQCSGQMSAGDQGVVSFEVAVDE